MKFRSRLFGVLAILTVLLVIGLVAGADPSNETCVETTNQAACEAGSAIGTGAAVSIVLCVGLILFVTFALLAWRNGAGYRVERRHREQLEAAKGQ